MLDAVEPGKGEIMRQLWNWWLNEWDFIAIWAGIAIIGLLVAGAISATIDAWQAASVYH